MKIFLFIIWFFTISNPAICQNKDRRLFSFYDEDGHCGFKNKKGKILIKAEYFSCPYSFVGKGFVSKFGEEGWIGIDSNNNVQALVPFIFDNGPDYIEDGLFRFIENNKIGFTNKSWEKVIPAEYDFAHPFEAGIAEFFVGGKKIYLDEYKEHWFWGEYKEKGYINKKNERFKEIEKLSNNRRKAITYNGELVILNKKGIIIK